MRMRSSAPERRRGPQQSSVTSISDEDGIQTLPVTYY